MWEKAFSEAESHTPKEAVQRGRGHSSLRFAAKFNLGHHCIGLVKAWDHVTGSLPLDCRARHDPGPAGHQEEHLNLYQTEARLYHPGVWTVCGVLGGIFGGCCRQHQAQKDTSGVAMSSRIFLSSLHANKDDKPHGRQTAATVLPDAGRPCD